MSFDGVDLLSARMAGSLAAEQVQHELVPGPGREDASTIRRRDRRRGALDRRIDHALIHAVNRLVDARRVDKRDRPPGHS